PGRAFSTSPSSSMPGAAGSWAGGWRRISAPSSCSTRSTGLHAAPPGGRDPLLRSGLPIHVDRVRAALSQDGRAALHGLAWGRVAPSPAHALGELFSPPRGPAPPHLPPSSPSPPPPRPVSKFTEGWSTPPRRHSALDYLSPINYERSHFPMQ